MILVIGEHAMKTPSAAEKMTKKIQSIKLEDSIRTADQMIRDGRIRHLAVRDSKGKIVGILSDRDVARATQFSRNGAETEMRVKNEDCVHVFMSSPVETVTIRDSVVHIAERMIQEKKSCFLVTGDNDHEPQGIITSEDLLKTLVELCKSEPSQSKLSLADVWSETFLV